MSAIKNVASAEELDKLIQDAGRGVVVMHFWAAWAPQCQQVTDAMKELAADPHYVNTTFATVEAESLPAISQKYEISAVPTCILVKGGDVVDRVNGANVPELTKKSRHHASLSSSAPRAPTLATVDINTQLKTLINKAPVMLFMKGNADEPRCGFSKQMIEILQSKNIKYSTFDILGDEQVRQELKKFSNWPTYPQLYANGELIGGLDIVKELVESGEFESQLPKQESLEDRLKALIKKEKIMLFMKGSPLEPRCGFSKTLTGILAETGTKYGHFDILGDEEVRQGLKKFSNWPTYPQLYVNGELVGGLDIVKEMKESGDLEEALKG